MKRDSSDFGEKDQERLSFEYLRELVDRGKLSRRQLLSLTSYLAALGLLDAFFKPLRDATSYFEILGPADAAVLTECNSDFEWSVLRVEDMLNLHFNFFNLNLKLDGPLGPRLDKVREGEAAYLVVEFPAQNIAEEAFLEGDSSIQSDPDLDPYGNNPSTDEPLAEPGDVGARLSGPSRLAFKVPNEALPIPYTLEALLSWTNYEQNVVPVALPRPIIITPLSSDLSLSAAPVVPPDEPPIPPPEPPIETPEIREPKPCETAIEAPWRLFISPNKTAGWAHSNEPVTHKKWTELWHTRLGKRRLSEGPDGPYYDVDEQNEFYRTIRAIWTPGFDIPDYIFFWLIWSEPFRMSLTESDRRKLVRLTSDFNISSYTPKPVDVDRLMLTSLGAWMNFDGRWKPPISEPSLDIENWIHEGTMGRDHYVRVVYKGFLFPFGHQASLIKVTERKFQKPPSQPLGGPTAAYLRQRFYIVVRQPEMNYPVAGQLYNGRELPFKKVRLTTLVTPNLDDPNAEENEFLDGEGQQAFWPRVGGNDFLFHIVAEDWEGKLREFTAPLAFLSPAKATTDAQVAVDTYKNYNDPNDPKKLPRRKREMNGQKIAYAPSNKPGDTSLETKELVFSAEVNEGASEGLPHFYPTMEKANIRLSAAEQVSGSELVGGTTFVFHQRYRDHEFNKTGNDSTKNMGEVFAELESTAPLEFGKSDKSGGVVTPNFGIYGISRSLGPVGKNPKDGDNLGGWLASEFDPAEYFGDTAKLLGGVLLGQVMKKAPISENSEDQDEIFKITSRDIYDGGTLPVAVETKLFYKRESDGERAMKSDLLEIFEPEIDNSLEINATFRTELNSPNESTSEVVGDIRKFHINLVKGPTGNGLNFITIYFNKLVFTSKNGQKPDIDVDIANVKLGGPLEFVNELQKYLQMGSGIEVTADGITAIYTLPIPSVAVGVFSIQNISFSAGVNIPFTGEPARVRFAFCERENQFLLTVCMFGGGGFFGIALGLDGMELLEASFEFGANISIDIGVASGGVYIMAGVYFKLEVKDGQENAFLEGYLRMGGELEVLGIVSISVEFYLGLSYEGPPKDEVWGQATLTVEIEVLLFSASVELSVERRFAGSTHQLFFEDLVPLKADWEAYADAFAPIPA